MAIRYRPIDLTSDNRRIVVFDLIRRRSRSSFGQSCTPCRTSVSVWRCAISGVLLCEGVSEEESEKEHGFEAGSSAYSYSSRRICYTVLYLAQIELGADDRGLR